MSEVSYEGCKDFRMRTVISLLTGRPVRIAQIRPRAIKAGLSDAEVSFLRLIDQITSGTTISIGERRTRVFLKPAHLTGGSFTFEAHSSRGLGYYLEPLLLLAPFCKAPLDVTLRGVCNNNIDPSIEMIQHTWLPLYRRFLGAAAAEKLELKLTRRGAHPDGGAEVHLVAPNVAQLQPLRLVESRKVFKVRGVAWTCKVSPGICQRMVSAAKTVFKGILADVYVTADACKGERGGNSPGFGLTLYAETKDGCFFAAEATSEPSGASRASVPEELGADVAKGLCKEILLGGCVDRSAQGLVLALMAFCPRDVSSVLTGPLTPHAVATLRLIKDFAGVQFQLRPRLVKAVTEEEEDANKEEEDVGEQLLCTCVGSGRRNFEKVAGRDREFVAKPLAI